MEEISWYINITNTWIGIPACSTAECWISTGRHLKKRGGGSENSHMMSLKAWYAWERKCINSDTYLNTLLASWSAGDCKYICRCSTQTSLHCSFPKLLQLTPAITNKVLKIYSKTVWNLRLCNLLDCHEILTNYIRSTSTIHTSGSKTGSSRISWWYCCKKGCMRSVTRFMSSSKAATSLVLGYLVKGKNIWL